MVVVVIVVVVGEIVVVLQLLLAVVGHRGRETIAGDAGRGTRAEPPDVEMKWQPDWVGRTAVMLSLATDVEGSNGYRHLLVPWPKKLRERWP